MKLYVYLGNDEGRIYDGTDEKHPAKALVYLAEGIGYRTWSFHIPLPFKYTERTSYGDCRANFEGTMCRYGWAHWVLQFGQHETDTKIKRFINSHLSVIRSDDGWLE